MKIAVHDSENNGYPNLALMKLSAWHKEQGDTVEWFSSLFGEYHKVYSSKVFTYTKPDPYLPESTSKGGFGYGSDMWLPEDIEHICPDYSLYDCNQSYGFLTRGVLIVVTIVLFLRKREKLENMQTLKSLQGTKMQF